MIHDNHVIEDRGHDTPCWVWRGSMNQFGYGRYGSGLAHGAYYARDVGPVPEGLELDHLCRVRCCVNPEHLEPVTRAENIRRGLLTKLTSDDVRAIRKSDEQTCVLAKRHGVTGARIRQIKRGRGWEDVGGPIHMGEQSKPKLTWTQVAEIRLSSETGAALAEKFGVSFSLVCRVRRGECWIAKAA